MQIREKTGFTTVEIESRGSMHVLEWDVQRTLFDIDNIRKVHEEKDISEVNELVRAYLKGITEEESKEVIDSLSHGAIGQIVNHLFEQFELLKKKDTPEEENTPK